MAREVSSDIRERIISAYNGHYHPRDIATMFNCSVTTVKRIIKRYLIGGEAPFKPRGGSKNKKLIEIHKETIKKLYGGQLPISLRAIQKNILRDFNLVVGISSIDRTI
ncbi:hypothetical protein CDIK_4298 [Cucumispora dikerogammari]|nr:hypothetical protein CDIK_4298 [Cucumispora dikerogammari]